MLDTTFAVTGKQLSHSGKTYTITSSGIKDDQPFASVDPHDDTVVQTIVKHIRKCMPLPFVLEDIQKDLA